VNGRRSCSPKAPGPFPKEKGGLPLSGCFVAPRSQAFGHARSSRLASISNPSLQLEHYLGEAQSGLFGLKSDMAKWQNGNATLPLRLSGPRRAGMPMHAAEMHKYRALDKTTELVAQ